MEFVHQHITDDFRQNLIKLIIINYGTIHIVLNEFCFTMFWREYCK